MKKNIYVLLTLTILLVFLFPLVIWAHTSRVLIGNTLVKSDTNSVISPKLGVIHVAIILVEKPGNTEATTTPLQINNAMNKLNLFIQENSYGKASLAWDIYGPYKTNGVINDPTLNEQHWLVADPDVDFRKYSVVISASAGLYQCTIACGGVFQSGEDGAVLSRIKDQPINSLGIVKIGQTDFLDYYNYSSAIYNGENSQDVNGNIIYSNGILSHEFGHALGFEHSGVSTCYTTISPGLPPHPTPVTKTICGWEEYGDAFDTMGGGEVVGGPYNSTYKELVDWISEKEGSIKTITQKGVYRLYPYENKIWPVVLKIPRELKSGEKCADINKNRNYYYLEFRTPYDGSDYHVVRGNKPLGPQVRYINFDSKWAKGYYGTDLPDRNLNTRGVEDDNNVVTQENIFYDATTSVKIAIKTVTKNYVDIDVDPGYKVCGTPNPPPPPYWTGSLSPNKARVGDTVSISWDYKNPPDDVQCRISNNVLGTTGWIPGPIQPKDSRRVLITTSTSTSSYSTATKREFRLECSNVSGVKSIYGTTLTIIPTPASTSTPPGPNNINCSVTLNTSRDYSTKTIVTGLTQCATQSSCMTPYPHTDACANTTILNKYYCAAGYVVVDQHACPYGCSNGICNSPTARAKNTKISLVASVIQVIEGIFNLK